MAPCSLNAPEILRWTAKWRSALSAALLCHGTPSFSIKANKESLYRSNLFRYRANRVVHGRLSRDHFSVEAIDATTVFAQMAALQAKPLNVFENRNQQITDGHDKALKFLVKRILPKVIIQVSDQMDEAFLLPTGERVVSSIKVGHDSALEGGK